MSTQSELHNKIVGGLVKMIVQTPLDAGGRTSDVLVVLESVVAGVLIAISRIDGATPSGRDTLLMALESGVRDRMVEIEVRG